jgi:hypothetical protein
MFGGMFGSRPLDWKGNEIKVGDVVQLVHVNSGGWIVALSFEELKTKKPTPETYEWEIKTEFTVAPPRRKCETQRNDGGTITLSFGIPTNIEYKPDECPLDDLQDAMFHITMDGSIICIKGVSDNQEEYYTEKFKV